MSEWNLKRSSKWKVYISKFRFLLVGYAPLKSPSSLIAKPVGYFLLFVCDYLIKMDLCLKKPQSNVTAEINVAGTDHVDMMQTINDNNTYIQSDSGASTVHVPDTVKTDVVNPWSYL